MTSGNGGDRWEFVEFEDSPDRDPRLPQPEMEGLVPGAPRAAHDLTHVHAGAHLQVVEVVGGQGTGPGEFGRPVGLHVDLRGNLYVADADQRSVRRITPEGEVWTCACSSADSRVDVEQPWDVAVDRDGMMYVLDRGGRVQKMDADGGYQHTFGMPGSHLGQLRYPQGLALDSRRNVYVADTWNHRVSVFHPRGRLQSVWRGAEVGGFERPRGVAVTRHDEVIVCDTLNHRLVVHNVLGAVLEVIEGYRSGAWRFRLPVSVDEDPFSNLWIIEGQGGKLSKVDRNGQLLTSFGPDLGGNLGTLESPSSVGGCLDGDLYVSDQGARRILKLGYRD